MNELLHTAAETIVCLLSLAGAFYVCRTAIRAILNKTGRPNSNEACLYFLVDGDAAPGRLEYLIRRLQSAISSRWRLYPDRIILCCGEPEARRIGELLAGEYVNITLCGREGLPFLGGGRGSAP